VSYLPDKLVRSGMNQIEDPKVALAEIAQQLAALAAVARELSS
jgi:hypothetical protein